MSPLSRRSDASEHRRAVTLKTDASCRHARLFGDVRVKKTMDGVDGVPAINLPYAAKFCIRSDDPRGCADFRSLGDRFIESLRSVIQTNHLSRNQTGVS